MHRSPRRRLSPLLGAVVAVSVLALACEPRARRERPTVSVVASTKPSEAPAPSVTAPAPAVLAPFTLAAQNQPNLGAPATPSGTASAHANTPPSASPPLANSDASAPRVCRVALIGDSFTDRRSAGGGLYVRYLEQRCPESQFVNFAKGGTMVNQMRKKLLGGLLTGAHFTHLIVFGGVNDLYSDETAGRTPAKAEADLAAMYAEGKAQGLRVVGLTVAPWAGFTRYYNPRRAAATHELNAWILAQPAAGTLDATVDAFSLLSCGDPERLCPRYEHAHSDGLHFGKAGHEVLGSALYAAEFKHCR